MATHLLRPLNTPVTLRGAVADHLRTAIILGELAPGLVITETQLAARLGVSATPVREALLDLSSEGLVEIEPNRLKRVTPIELEAMLGLLKVQAALWRMGYVWAFPRLQLSHLDELERTVSAYETALGAKDILGAIRAGHAFHTVFIEASGNPELLRVTLDRRSLIARFVLLRGAATISQAGLNQHRSMLHSLKRGDTEDVLARLDQLAAKLIALAQPDEAGADDTAKARASSRGG